MYSLILSRSENEHANAIYKFLVSHGLRLVRINMDDINSKPPTVSISADDRQSYIKIGNKKILTQDIKSIFVHIPRIEINEKVGKDLLDRKIISSSWQNFISSLEAVLPNALWVNRPSASGQSTNIIKQLNMARKIGLNVPDTLFSNDLNEVKKFSKKFKHIILKTGPLLGVHFNNQRILSQIVNPSGINKRELILSPCFFQEYIDKDYELRIHVVKNKILTCRIESQQSAKTRVDWRNYDLANTPHYPFELDGEIGKMCIDLVNKLGLTLGIIDMIVTKEKKYVFLECNAHGHWIWIEELTGLPITKEVCNLLMN